VKPVNASFAAIPIDLSRGPRVLVHRTAVDVKFVFDTFKKLLKIFFPSAHRHTAGCMSKIYELSERTVNDCQQLSDKIMSLCSVT